MGCCLPLSFFFRRSEPTSTLASPPLLHDNGLVHDVPPPAGIDNGCVAPYSPPKPAPVDDAGTGNEFIVADTVASVVNVASSIVLHDMIADTSEPGADYAGPATTNGTDSNDLVAAAHSTTNHSADSGNVAGFTADKYDSDSGDNGYKSSTSSDSSNSERKQHGDKPGTGMLEGSVDGDLIRKEKEKEEKKMKEKKEEEEKKEKEKKKKKEKKKHHHGFTQKLHDLKEHIKEDGSHHLQEIKDQMIGVDQGNLMDLLGSARKYMLLSFKSEEDKSQDGTPRPT